MTHQTLAARIGELADAVLSDPRWVRDDLNVSILGMLLYGFAMAAARETSGDVAEVEEQRAHTLGAVVDGQQIALFVQEGSPGRL